MYMFIIGGVPGNDVKYSKNIFGILTWGIFLNLLVFSIYKISTLIYVFMLYYIFFSIGSSSNYQHAKTDLEYTFCVVFTSTILFFLRNQESMSCFLIVHVFLTHACKNEAEWNVLYSVIFRLFFLG